ncbi:hypothetical protein P7C70_g5115, partial [Phenoliferia sp. Uapishka_3]
MLFKSTIIILAAAASVNAHGKLLAITGANGAKANGLAIDPAVPNTVSISFSAPYSLLRKSPSCNLSQGSTKTIEADTTIFGAKTNRNPDAASGCGKTPGGGAVDCAQAAAKSLATSGGTVPTANADGTVDLTFHQVNQDGAGPLAAMVSGDMGATWQAATVQENVKGTIGLSAAKNVDVPVRVQVPAGTSCGGTAGTATGVCLVALANPIAGFGGSAPFQMANAAPAAAAPAAAASPAKAPVAARQVPGDVAALLESEGVDPADFTAKKRQVPADVASLLESEGVDPADFQIKAFLHKRHVRDFTSLPVKLSTTVSILPRWAQEGGGSGTKQYYTKVKQGNKLIPESESRQICLLDLPDEMLAKIMSGVAPLGGRKVHALRLVNRRLSTVASSVFFASVNIPRASLDDNDDLFALLLENRYNIRETATSITYSLHGNGLQSTPAAAIKSLGNLSRVLLMGPPRGNAHDLPDVVQQALSSQPKLHTLSLANFWFPVGPHTEGTLLTRCGSQVRHLTLDNISGDGLYAHMAQDPPELMCLPENGVQVLEVYHPRELTGSGETRQILLALYTCRKSVREINLEWKEAAPTTADHYLPVIGLLSDSAKSLSIQGLLPLFNAQYGPAHLTTSSYMSTFLGYIGKSPLPKLSLPVFKSFDVNSVLLTLRLPKIKYLSLSTSPFAAFLLAPDFLTSAIYSSLSTFLTSSIFPALLTLHLTGWLDTTDIVTLATIPPSDLAISYNYVFGLLGILRVLGARNLVLENSNGHPSGDAKCHFQRIGESGDWTVKLKRYW